MMKTSTKLSVTVAASMLGIALAASGAYAATGALTTRDAPGQVLQVSGVGPASDHATATVHANGKLPSVAKAPRAKVRVAVPSVTTAVPLVTASWKATSSRLNALS